ncbi:MAG TPA: glycosyltransferase [Patescibacteria group bacterium]|nr:glycosyltransferase [Patescibacteria group bacterium]
MIETIHQPIVAAIPNYNMALSLKELLPNLIRQNYDQIVVLDDASSDDSVAVAKSFENVAVIVGKANLGSGGNRNRILEIIPQTSEAIIHFIDADTTLDTTNTPEKINTVFTDPAVIAMGGLVKNIDGSQFLWNWGDKFTPQAQLSMTLASKFSELMATDRSKAEQYWKRFSALMKHTPNPFKEPAVRDVFWVSEANLMIRAHDFRDIGGFDPNLRVHDIFDIAVKLKLRNQTFRFDPSVIVTHKAIDVRGDDRQAEEQKAMLYLFRKYGLKLFF